MKETAPRNVLASVSLSLEIPVKVAQGMLFGTAFEGYTLGSESDIDREQIGKILEQRIGEELDELLEYCHSDPDVEADW